MTPAEQDMMASFRRDYLDLLDDRVARIRQLLSDRLTEEARVALLSLESSSAMVGADRLTAVSRRLRSVLGEGGDRDELPALLEELATEAVAARDEVGGRAG